MNLIDMKKVVFVLSVLMLLLPLGILAQDQQSYQAKLQEGKIVVTPLSDNAVRIKYIEGEVKEMPELVYCGEKAEKIACKVKEKQGVTSFLLKDMTIYVDSGLGQVRIDDIQGKTLFCADKHELKRAQIMGEPTREAILSFQSSEDEYLYGLGQFQDGYLNVKGLTRRLTQVNTQISIPFIISNKGYGVMWNNYGLTNFNPAENRVELKRLSEVGEKVTVNVTSTEGGRREVRQDNRFVATVEIPEDGEYAILLDVGQKMARRHNLDIDGKNYINLRNVWLPPTTSIIVSLKAGKHDFSAVLESGDRPSIYYKKVDDKTTFHSPVAECVDYTVFVGDADRVISTYRRLTGDTPMIPKWALGYIHCRERFNTQAELLATAERFRKEGIPIDLIVQDWQYWGKYGWNAMRFDEGRYPDPAQMTRKLHEMDMKLMISVWSKIDENAELGRQAKAKGYYIPRTSWIDFFNKEATEFYWKNMSDRLLKPYSIDAWWQDATEPENDDLAGRRINNGKELGDRYRNIYPNLVSQTVYEGLRKDDPSRRGMIFTRSGFSGIQRYASVLWSGDVGHDWQTLRYQISAGLGFNAAGLPWWTYDAGGFFRPYDQYTNKGYIEQMLRWIEVSTFLPMMRVHGYTSNTEPWNYGDEAKRIITDNIKLRYRLLPYIYSEVAKVSFDGSTLMRPLVFDFADDKQALEQDVEYMFGEAMLISPVCAGGVSEWQTYLPQNKAGWYDFWSGEKYEGGKSVTTKVSLERIPVFVKGGSILPIGPDRQHVNDKADAPIEIRVYAGADAEFELYEDEGDNYNYEQGAYSIIGFKWDEKKQTLTIGNRMGKYSGMPIEREFVVTLNGEKQVVKYNGVQLKVKF